MLSDVPSPVTMFSFARMVVSRNGGISLACDSRLLCVYVYVYICIFLLIDMMVQALLVILAYSATIPFVDLFQMMTMTFHQLPWHWAWYDMLCCPLVGHHMLTMFCLGRTTLWFDVIIMWWHVQYMIMRKELCYKFMN